MNREEAISEWTFRSNHIKRWLKEYGEEPSIRHYVELIDMAIEALSADAVQEAVPMVVRVTMSDGSQYYLEHEGDAIQADAELKMTEEVREALMRLTMCAREECGMCKYKDECGFDFQYKISTDNMNTLYDALMRSRCEVDAK